MARYLSSPIPAKMIRDKIAAAEIYMKLNDNREAIRCCIEIASLLGDRTPEKIYHLLSQAYAQNKESFGGTLEENQVWGDHDKHEILELTKELVCRLLDVVRLAWMRDPTSF